MTIAQNLEFASPGPALGIPEGWNLYGRRVGSPTYAAFAARARAALANPNAFADAPWTLVGLTVDVGAETAPDGTAADVLYETAVNEEHRATLTLVGGTDISAGQYVFGAYVKLVGGLSYAGASYRGDGASAAFITLPAGRLRTAVVPDLELEKISAHVVDVGSDWLRISILIEINTAIDAVPIAELSIRPGGSASAYLGSASHGVAVWGAFLSAGAQHGFESFEEGWQENERYSPTITASGLADFETGLINDALHRFEDFEHGWANYPFSPHNLIELAIFNAGGTPVVFESFEHGWPNYTQALSPHITAQTAAAFAPGSAPAESFEASWNNDTYSPTIVTKTAAAFGHDLDTFESFEDVVLDRLVVVHSDVELVSPAHGLTNGTVGYLRPQAGGVQIGNTYANVRYYVIDADDDPDLFSLSLTEGGGPVSFLDAGVGDQFFKGDPTRYWTSADGDPLI